MIVVRKSSFLTLIPSTSNDDEKILYNNTLFYNKQFSSFFVFISFLRSVLVNKVTVYGTFIEEQVRLTLRKKYFLKGNLLFLSGFRVYTYDL